MKTHSAEGARIVREILSFHPEMPEHEIKTKVRKSIL